MAQDINKPFGLLAAGLYEITDAVTPTYENKVSIPCPISLEFDREITEAELEGGDVVCDVVVKNRNLTFTLTFGGTDLAVWAIVLGESDPTDGGSTPNAYTYIDIESTATPREFGLIAQATNSAGGDTHIILFRCMAKEGPGGAFSQGEHLTTEFSGIGRERPPSGTEFARILNHETRQAVPTAWPGTTAY